MNELRTAEVFPFQVNRLSLGGREMCVGGSSWQEAEPDHYVLMGKSIKSLPLQNVF